MPGQFSTETLNSAAEFPVFSTCVIIVPTPKVSSDVEVTDIIAGLPAGTERPRNDPLRFKVSLGCGMNTLGRLTAIAGLPAYVVVVV